MPETLANEYVTTLNGAITNSATSIVVTIAPPASLSGGNFRMRLGPATDTGAREYILVGSVSGTTLSGITRGVEGTTAVSWGNGDRIAQVLTVAGLSGATLSLNSGVASDYIARVKLTADTTYRTFLGLDASSNGAIEFGPGGSAARDVTISRAGVAILASDSYIRVVSPSATTPRALTVIVSGDAQNRVELGVDTSGAGRLQFGSGTAAPDVSLYRAGVGSLKTDDSFTVIGALYGGSLTSPGARHYKALNAANGTLFIPTNVSTTAGAALVTNDGNDFCGFFHFYRGGTYNVLNGIAAGTGAEFRGTTFSAGTGGHSFYIESNLAGARIAMKNNTGSPRNYTFWFIG